MDKEEFEKDIKTIDKITNIFIKDKCNNKQIINMCITIIQTTLCMEKLNIEIKDTSIEEEE